MPQITMRPPVGESHYVLLSEAPLQEMHPLRRDAMTDSEMISVEPAKSVLWAPPEQAAILGMSINAMILIRGMDIEDVEDAIRAFRHMRRGGLVVASNFPLHGYSFGPATCYFLDGCPDDRAWRVQARGRCERAHPRRTCNDQS